MAESRYLFDLQFELCPFYRMVVQETRHKEEEAKKVSISKGDYPMAIDPRLQTPGYQALVTACASFRMQLPHEGGAKTNSVVSAILAKQSEQIQHAIKSFDTVQHMDKPSPKMQEDFERLRQILVMADILTDHGKLLNDDEKVVLFQCMKQYERCLETYTHRLNLPHQQMEGIKRNLSIVENLEKFAAERTSQIYASEIQEKAAIPDIENIQCFSTALALFPAKAHAPAGPSKSKEAREGEITSAWVRAQLREGSSISPEDEYQISECEKDFYRILQDHGQTSTPDSRLVREGVLSLKRLRARDGNISYLQDFPLLRRVLAKSQQFIRSRSHVADAETQRIVAAVKEFNKLVDDWGQAIDAPEEEKKNFVRSMSLQDDVEQSEHPEIQQQHSAKVEKHRPPKPASIPPKTFGILYEPGTQPMFGETNFVRYMVKYLIGCKMLETAEAKAASGETPPPFTIDDLEKLGLPKILRDAQRTEHLRVTTFNDMKIVDKDLASRIKNAKGPEKRKLEATLADLQKIDKRLTEQTAKFETFSSFIGKDRALAFSSKGEQYAELKVDIERAHAKVEQVRAELKKK
jgi:hypothetical protein